MVIHLPYYLQFVITKEASYIFQSNFYSLSMNTQDPLEFLLYKYFCKSRVNIANVYFITKSIATELIISLIVTPCQFRVGYVTPDKNHYIQVAASEISKQLRWKDGYLFTSFFIPTSDRKRLVEDIIKLSNLRRVNGFLMAIVRRSLTDAAALIE